ncbi:hypothetical protein GCM10010360_66760 [Streptomyces nogalater]
MALLCAVFGAVLLYGQAVVVRHRAAGGADLAALAAADHWAEGGTAACARAGRLAAGHGARLVRCAIVGDTAEVTAAVRTGPFAAEARARAGPPGPLPSGLRDGLGAVPPAGPGSPGSVPSGIGGGLGVAPLAGPGSPGPLPPGLRDGLRTAPSAEPGPPGSGPPGLVAPGPPDGPRAIPPAEPGPPSAPLTP